MLKKALLAAAFVMGASAASAATCTVGSCTSTSADGQSLDAGVLYDIDQIGAGAFTFAGNFINDTSYDGAAIAVGLGGALGEVSDLVLTILSPMSVAQSYNLANNTSVMITLAPASGSVIDFELTGTSAAGKGGALPDVNLFISAVPLPAGVLLMGTALAGFGVASRRRRKS